MGRYISLIPKIGHVETMTQGVVSGRDKPGLLNFVALAMNLGKEGTQFMADSDFDAYKQDPDFLAVLE